MVEFYYGRLKTKMLFVFSNISYISMIFPEIIATV